MNRYQAPPPPGERERGREKEKGELEEFDSIKSKDLFSKRLGISARIARDTEKKTPTVSERSVSGTGNLFSSPATPR